MRNVIGKIKVHEQEYNVIDYHPSLFTCKDEFNNIYYFHSSKVEITEEINMSKVSKV